MAGVQGEHYRAVPGGEEHHARVSRLSLNWYAANITKYAERAELKGFLLSDIEKIIKYATLWKEAVQKDAEGGADKSYVRQGD